MHQNSPTAIYIQKIFPGINSRTPIFRGGEGGGREGREGKEWARGGRGKVGKREGIRRGRDPWAHPPSENPGYAPEDIFIRADYSFSSLETIFRLMSYTSALPYSNSNTVKCILCLSC